MTRLADVARSVVAAFFLVSCSHEPRTTYDVNLPERWDLGEVVTRSERDESQFALLDDAGKEIDAPGRARSRIHESRIVQRCLETESDGALRRSLVFVELWSFRENAAEDRSLEGAFVETSPAGWVPRPKDVVISAAARAWLDGQFGPGSRPDAALTGGFRAPHPLAVGEGWETPSDEFVRQALGARSASSFRFSLASVSSTPLGDAVHVTEVLDAPFESASSDAAAGYIAGSRMTMRGDVTFVPGRAHRSSDKTFTGDTTFVSMKDGREFRAIGKSTTHSTSSAGGTMPEPRPK